jgi:hypothetical protein
MFLAEGFRPLAATVAFFEGHHKDCDLPTFFSRVLSLQLANRKNKIFFLSKMGGKMLKRDTSACYVWLLIVPELPIVLPKDVVRLIAKLCAFDKFVPCPPNNVEFWKLC